MKAESGRGSRASVSTVMRTLLDPYRGTGPSSESHP